jgi:hypothetical protein
MTTILFHKWAEEVFFSPLKQREYKRIIKARACSLWTGLSAIILISFSRNVKPGIFGWFSSHHPAAINANHWTSGF